MSEWTDSYRWPRPWLYRLLVATGWENAAADRVRVTEWVPPNHSPLDYYSTRRALWLTFTGRRHRA